MMLCKRFWFFAAVLAICAMGIPGAMAQDSYESPSRGFSIQPPNGWTVEEAPGRVLFRHPAGECKGRLVAEIIVRSQAAKDYPGFLAAVERRLEAELPEFNLHDRQDTQVDGRKARLLTFRYEKTPGKESSRVKALQLLVDGARRKWTVTCKMRDKKFKELKDECSKALLSFKELDQGSPAVSAPLGGKAAKPDARPAADASKSVALPQAAAPRSVEPTKKAVEPGAKLGGSGGQARVTEASGQSVAVLDDIGVEENRVLLRLTGKVKHRTELLGDPPRLMVELYGAEDRVPSKDIPGKGKLITGIRHGQYKGAPDMISRIVVDLSGDVPYRVSSEGKNLVLDLLAGGNEAAARPEPSAPAAAKHGSSAPDAHESGIEYVTIPGGSFVMGDAELDYSKPTHRITVKPFQISKTEVTFGQYRRCVEAGVCAPAHVSDGTCWVLNGSRWAFGNLPASFQGDNQPVVCVDWSQAKAFAQWAGGKLPSEAEWEYAARSAGKERKYPWGDEAPSCDRVVMVQGGLGCGRNSTWPVCSKTAGNTEQGLCDMAGNVWEWTQDWYHDSYNGAPTDGSAWESPVGSFRAVRGGCWDFALPRTYRAAARFGPGGVGASFGFRVAREHQE